MLTRRRFAGLFAASALPSGLLAGPVLAQSSAQTSAQAWPTRVVRVICPIAAGGAIDAVARLIAGRLSEAWAQQVVVENRTGGGVNIAAEAVARSEPDGYTIFATPSSLSVAGFLFPSLSYDPVADFAPVSLIGFYPNIMVVPVSSPAHSVKEFIDYAKANPGKITYASGGHGSSLHLAGELFKRMTGIEMTHVPYRGCGTRVQRPHPRARGCDVQPHFLEPAAGQARQAPRRSRWRHPSGSRWPRNCRQSRNRACRDSTCRHGSACSCRQRRRNRSSTRSTPTPSRPSPIPRPGKSSRKWAWSASGSTPADLAAQVKADVERWGPLIREAGISLRN